MREPYKALKHLIRPLRALFQMVNINKVGVPTTTIIPTTATTTTLAAAASSTTPSILLLLTIIATTTNQWGGSSTAPIGLEKREEQERGAGGVI